MIRYQKDMETGTEVRPAGGRGAITFETLFSPREMGGRTGMFAAVTLEPHGMVGEHRHTAESEIYYILQGAVDMIEDGVRYPMTAGDAELCLPGHTHGMENTTDQPVLFLAMELKEQV